MRISGYDFLFLIISFSLLSIVNVKSEVPAFPGAWGGGMYTTGGRGGTVYYVNTLADNNTGNSVTREGSLRWCIGQSGARTILFKVSGLINLTSKISIKNGNLTIAGQSAPGDGICLKGYEVSVDADNVIIRYIMFRMGDINNVESDALWGRYRKNLIIDHCSMSWSVDECSSFYNNSNFTMQWCFLSESLRVSVHDKGSHGYCGLWGGKNATFHHNLMAHHDSRNPRYNGWKRDGLDYNNPFDEERMDFTNNVVYNYGSNGGYGGESAGKYNVVNNYYKPGPATSSTAAGKFLQIDIDKGATIILPRHGKFYVTGNVIHNNTSVNSNNINGIRNNTGFPMDTCLVNVPYVVLPIMQHTAAKALEKVVAYAGASLKRDTVDSRIARETITGTYTYTGSKGKTKGIIDTQSDVGGWPVYNSLTAPADSDIDGIPDGWLEANYPGKKAKDLNSEGYTYLEVYLNSLVSEITQNQDSETIISGIQLPMTGIENPKAVFIKGINSIQIIAPANIEEIFLISLDGKIAKFDKANKTSTHLIECSNMHDGIYIVNIKYTNGIAGKTKVLIKN
jgi:hypothetical protein